MQARKQVSALEIEMQQLCIYVVTKRPAQVIPLEVSKDIAEFVEKYAVRNLLERTRHVEAVELRSDSVLKELASNVGNAELCANGFAVVQQYSTTLRSRSALVVVAKFKFDGRSFVGFFQLRETAVMALYPIKKELKVIERAFRRFEKASLLPSVVEGRQASVFQRAKSRYFEKFVGVNRPPTAEEALESLIEQNEIENLSGLLRLLERFHEVRQAKVIVELDEVGTKVRADEITKTLAKKGIAVILVGDGAQASIRIGKKTLSVDLEALRELGQVLKERGIS